MDLPKAAGTSPVEFELEAGKKYAWCSCGLSGNQPLCDGSHKETTFTPHVFQATETKTVHFCLCKKTGGQPFCDGSHASLADET